MRVFLAGASGVIGKPLVPALVSAGHEVIGMTRSADSAERIRAAGAEAVVSDVFDRGATVAAIEGARPEVVVSHLTDLPQDLGPRNIKRAYEANNRVREEGTANMLAGAKAAGARRIIVQNVCFLYAPEGSPVKSEDAPLYVDAPAPFGAMVRLHEEMERSVAGADGADGIEGIVLRFGWWYGPGTSFESGGATSQAVRKRRYPIVGAGTGLFSFCHVDDAVEATIAALIGGNAGVYNVCDDEPSPQREWLPEYATALGAPAPRRVPKLIARLAVGRYLAAQMTSLRGASNAKAKAELGWTPRYASWRQGFREALG